jgi:hypothetical protein
VAFFDARSSRKPPYKHYLDVRSAETEAARHPMQGWKGNEEVEVRDLVVRRFPHHMGEQRMVEEHPTLSIIILSLGSDVAEVRLRTLSPPSEGARGGTIEKLTLRRAGGRWRVVDWEPEGIWDAME